MKCLEIIIIMLLWCTRRCNVAFLFCYCFLFLKSGSSMDGIEESLKQWITPLNTLLNIFIFYFLQTSLGDIHVPNTQRVKKALELKLLHDLTPFQVFTNFTVKSDESIIEQASATIKAAF